MSNDSKTEFLQKEGLINLRPERVIHDLFCKHEFFDPLDLPQVRYEMLRLAVWKRLPSLKCADCSDSPGSIFIV